MRRGALTVVVIHAAVTTAHGAAHAQMHVDLPAAAMTFIVCVVMIAPLAALALLYSRWRHAGAALLALAMAGALVFGLWNHFLIQGADHVAHLAPSAWRLPFQVTAWLLLFTEAAGTVIGVLLLRRSLRQ